MRRKSGLAIRLLGLVIVLVGACTRNQENHYTTERVIRGATLGRFTNSFDKRISNTSRFLDQFVDSYRKTIISQVPPDFRTDLYLMQTNIAAQLVLSEVSETALLIFPSPERYLAVECTPYPVQLGMFTGRDESAFSPTNPVSLNRQLSSRDNELIQWYATLRWVFGELDQGSSFMEGGTFYVPNPKFVKLSEKAVLGVKNFTLVLTNSGKWHTTLIEDLALFTGGRDFGQVLDAAPDLGVRFAGFQIQILFIKSELFRASLAHADLKPVAEEILKRSDRAKTGIEEYPYWKLLRDMQRLADTGKKYGLTDNYINGFLSHAQEMRSDGSLLWKFNGVWGFVLQWTLPNLVFAILAVFLSYLWPKRGRPKRIVVFSAGIAIAAIISVNGWILKNKPQSVGLIHALAPGIFFACAGIPLGWKLFKLKAQSDARKTEKSAG